MCRGSRAVQWRGCASVVQDAIHCDGGLLFSALKRRLSLFIHAPAWCSGWQQNFAMIFREGAYLCSILKSTH